MESGKCLAGLPGGGGRGSAGGGPGQGLDLGTGREGNGGEGLPAAAGSAGETEREKTTEEGGAKAERERTSGPVVGKGDLRCSNAVLVAPLMCFKNAGMLERSSDRLPHAVPVTSPCAICASSGQHVISLDLNIPVSKADLCCTFSKDTRKTPTVLYRDISQGPLVSDANPLHWECLLWSKRRNGLRALRGSGL